MKTWLIPIFILFLTSNCLAQKNKLCDRFSNVVSVFNEKSISPLVQEQLNEDRFVQDLMVALDPEYVYFSSSDSSLLHKMASNLKNNFSQAFCEDYDSLLNLYTRRLKQSLSILESIRNTTLDFHQKESIWIGNEFETEIYKRNQNSRWISLVKSYVLEEGLESTAIFDSLQDNKQLNEVLESKKQLVIAREIRYIQKLLEQDSDIKQLLSDAYLNSLITQFDPYSFSFSKASFQDFRDHLSTYTQSYGIQIEKDHKGFIVISSIIPGSYAWRTGMINTGDVVIRIKSEKQVCLDIKDATIKDISEYLALAGDKIIFTFRTKSGEEKTVTLIQEETHQAENSVQAFILEGNLRIGYILLPAFYTSWDDETITGCSQDVGKAIYALKKENIDGLILDLRNNGGGSIYEAIDLAGLFIDYGTLLVGQNAKNEFTSLKDFNRGMMYSGPLAIMVNHVSASASEMVAAVLQDYKRAIIVGDTTFGKACGQSLIPLADRQEGMLKVTTSNYFRVTGHSYSYSGVIPDISFPFIDYIGIFAKKEMSKNKTYRPIERKTFYKPQDSIPLKTLRKISTNRILKSNKFSAIVSIDSTLKSKAYRKNTLSLDLDSYYSYLKNYEFIKSEMASINSEPSPNIEVSCLSVDATMAKTHKYYSDLLEMLKKSVESDPYIEETFHILTDYNTLLNTK